MATMGWLTALLIVPLLGVLFQAISTCYHLLRNYSSARSMGIPIRVVPISPLNPFWALVDRNIMRFLRRLPFGVNTFTRYNWRGWEVEDRWRSHREMGDIWVLVTPLKNWVYINDPNTIMSLNRRGGDFDRPAFINGM